MFMYGCCCCFWCFSFLYKIIVVCFLAISSDSQVLCPLYSRHFSIWKEKKKNSQIATIHHPIPFLPCSAVYSMVNNVWACPVSGWDETRVTNWITFTEYYEDPGDDPNAGWCNTGADYVKWPGKSTRPKVKEALSVLMLCAPVFIFTSGSSALLGRPRHGLSIWLWLLDIFNKLFWVFADFFHEKTDKIRK